MKRRELIKALGLTAISSGILLESCDTGTKKVPAADAKDTGSLALVDGREAFEIARLKKLEAETFFNEHEMRTITVLADIIIPKDEKSGSASDAKVPEFIGFIVKDIPAHQLPMRGGLKWLDMQCLKRYNKPFVDCAEKEQLELVTEIAYPLKAKPEMKQGVAFFSLMRNLTATGFYTSEMGIKDIGYVGNTPNKWAGVPQDVLQQYGLQSS
ncbi:gluconate 2-dehydrogenase subunit 3 family protein [Chitinophaga defluvii]|uniref:Gluconate 2-dehydrogenase subunit 3 family protein n=1 Tax=Chitinophaga defluvii TaxID=3163343 RepID=A0ABV2T170_9BACT